jgi:hypothetical protein
MRARLRGRDHGVAPPARAGRSACSVQARGDPVQFASLSGVWYYNGACSWSPSVHTLQGGGVSSALNWSDLNN